MSRLKKGRARRAKAKASKVVTYKIRPEFAHFAIEGTQHFIVGDFTPQTAQERTEVTLKFQYPPTFHGVIFCYGDKP